MEDIDYGYYAQMFGDVMDLFWKNQPKPPENMEYGRGESKILAYLSCHLEGANPGEIANHLHVGSGRVGNALKDLEEKELIMRCVNPKDRRKTIVILTEKGKEKAITFRTFLETKIKKTVDCLGTDDFETMCNLLKKFLNAFLKEEQPC